MKDKLIASVITMVLLTMFTVVNATTIVVDYYFTYIAEDGRCSIAEAILSANTDTAQSTFPGECPAGNGADTIELSIDINLGTFFENHVIYGQTGMPTISSSMVIDGKGFRIERIHSCNLDGMQEWFEFRLFRTTSLANLTLKNIILANGCADGMAGTNGSGGGLYNEGILTINQVTFIENKANENGAGVINDMGTITSISNSLFTRSHANNNGAGIYNNSSINLIENSTFSENSSISDGAGIYNSNTISSIQNVTFANNSTFLGGAIYNLTGSSIDLQNSLFDNNGANECNALNFVGNNNLSSSASTNCPATTTNATLNLQALADNGGTSHTHALLVGSDAIGAAINGTTTDQRGFPIYHTRDIGAFEVQGLTLCPTALMTDGFTTSVSTASELIHALECANFNGEANGGDTINLSNDIVITQEYENDSAFGQTGTPAISTIVVLDGNGFALQRDASLTCNLDSNRDAGEFRLLRSTVAANLSLQNIAIIGGCADGYNGFDASGAGLYNNGNLTVNQVTFKNNNALLYGGAITNINGDIASISSSLFVGNQADNSGGGLYNQNNITLIENSTFSENNASILGGGIYNGSSITTINNTTFANNLANTAGDAIYNSFPFASINLLNSLLDNNGNDECNSFAFTGSNNLSSSTTTNCSATTTNATINLQALADNGGVTQTHALSTNSDALNAAIGGTTTDQRGLPVFQTRDIGAYEAQGVEFCPINLMIDGFSTDVSTAAELIQAIECANYNGEANGGDTINLATDITITQEYENDSTFGQTGTPAISTIVVLDGKGFALQRDALLTCNLDSNRDAGEFRLLRSTISADLILQNITIGYGCADGSNVFDRTGGGMYNNGALTINQVIFNNNQALTVGGGLVHSSGTIAFISQSLFKNNQAGGYGAGLFNTAPITMIENSTFLGNYSLYEGGGIFNRNVISTIQNSTFSGNTADFGGGVYNASPGDINTVNNTTFANNLANVDGDAIYTVSQSINLLNSLFDNNGTNECSGNILGSNNLTSSNTTNCPAITTNATLNLQALADNGGATPTHAILPNSDAFNAAMGGTTTDQRGLSVFQTRDIGAYEVQGVELCPVNLMTDGFSTDVSTAAELIQAIECANYNGEANGGDTINLADDIIISQEYENDSTFGQTATPAISSIIILDGKGFSLSRDALLACNLDGNRDTGEFRLLLSTVSADLSLQNISIENGCADGPNVFDNSGGGLFNDGNLTINQVTFNNNQALSNGGGVTHNLGTIAFISQSLFFNNNTNGVGAGLFNKSIITMIENSTFSENNALADGGGIFNTNAIFSLQNSTFANNSATQNGGAIFTSPGSSMNLLNSLFDNNGNNECNTSNISGNNNLTTSASTNCIATTTNATLNLQVLTDNGGATLTHAISFGSDALNAGDINSTITDQRGFAADAVRDIGAYEAQVPVVTPPSNIMLEAIGATTPVTLGSATVDDADETGITATADMLGPFSVGIHPVTWTAVDSLGYIGTAIQTVTITDSTAPMVTAPADIVMEATGPMTAVSLGTATATDLVDGSLTATADMSSPFSVGVLTVTWSATDLHNNTGTATQTVTITDSTAPIITLLGNAIETINIGDNYTDAGATATDLVDGDLTNDIVVLNPTDVNTAGNYTITYNVVDSQGNNATQASRLVKVQASIGGTVTGLAKGSSVVLQNNLGDDLVVSADSSFTFSVSLDDLSFYAVTVLTQPTTPNQSCSVTNAQGQLNGANITNVLVSCITNQYFVGGVLSGLQAGNTVTLDNNGTETLLLGNNGVFVFVNPLSDQSSYNINVTTQPRSPNQTCSISNASGTLAGADVTTIQIDCVDDLFFIGGHVNGLPDAYDLIVTNNGTDAQNLSNNGAFVFATPLLDLEDYEVQFQLVPSSTESACEISNNIGVIDGADITDVSIACLFSFDLIYKDGFESP